MIASILILVVSVVLLAYWFRYSCLLLLRNGVEQEEAQGGDERFSIRMVLNRVDTERHLESLERALERDYQMLSYLVKHAADLELASVENRMLILDYKLMRICYRITRSTAPELSRKALREMAEALGTVARQTPSHSEVA